MWKMERAVSQKKTDAMNFPDPLEVYVIRSPTSKHMV